MGTLLLAASLVFLPARTHAQPADGRAGAATPVSLLDVPFLSQTEALCGGAAAAMVMRYWGATGVSAEEFAPLVNRAKEGIETAALVGAVKGRGYEALAVSGTAEIVQRQLADGRPVVALIEDRPRAFHYVVVVGWHARAVVLHDPARVPYLLMKPEEFERRWRRSSNWMLVIAPAIPAIPVPAPRLGVPTRSTDSESQLGVPTRSPDSESQLGVPTRSTDSESQLGVPTRSTDSESLLGVGRPAVCSSLVDKGIRLAQRQDLTGAERLLADAAYQCPGAAPLRELAGVRLLQRRWPEVRDLAERAVGIDADDAYAWRLLATARYVTGHSAGALEAWNRIGEPKVDLVSIGGLQRTSHRTVEQFLGVENGSLLTAAVADRARRRLDELPAATMTRFEYVPRTGGTIEVRAQVLERNVIPRGRLTWAAIGLRAAASRELNLPVSSLGRGGERLDVAWRFWPNRPGGSIALHVPEPFGLLSIDVRSERQAFTRLALVDAEQFTARGRVADWATDVLRWEARGGFARWRTVGSFGTVGTAARLASDRWSVVFDADAWLGGTTFAVGAVRGGWRSSVSRRGFVIDVSGAFESATRDAPPDIWPAGDTGHARQTLLRAHPVLEDGRLRVERIGRQVTQLTAEAQHWSRGPAGVALGPAIFLDVARTATRYDAGGSQGSLKDVDIGLGFRLALPARAGSFRADLAHGLRDGRNALSISWSPGL